MSKLFQNFEIRNKKRSIPVEDHIKNFQSLEIKEKRFYKKKFPEKTKENFERCFKVENLMKTKKRVKIPKKKYKGNFVLENITNAVKKKENRRILEDPNKFIYPIKKINEKRILWKDKKIILENLENKELVESIKKWELDKIGEKEEIEEKDKKEDKKKDKKKESKKKKIKNKF